MKTILKKIITGIHYRIKIAVAFVSGLYSYYKAQKLTKVQQEFAHSISFFKAKTKAGKKDGIVLVQMVKDYEYTIKLAAASKVIAEREELEVDFYDVNWTYWLRWEPILQKAYTRFTKPRLEKIYQSFGGSVIFKTSEKYHDQEFIKQELTRLIAQIKTREDVLSLKFETVLAGDLIYDTYLRYFHKPTLELIDQEVILVIEIALNIYYSFKLLLKNNPIKCLLTTYSGYLEHGIPARVCLEEGINVYTIGSHTYIAQKLTTDFPYHQINHTTFRPDKKLTIQQLELARHQLTSRFEGKIDSATSYMRQSAYSDVPLNKELEEMFAKASRNIVIYVHDFYDSPHVNQLLQFPDLYQWLKQTLDALTDLKQTNVFIKTHPNGLSGCKEKTIELVNSYAKEYFQIIDESVSNLNIIELKPDLIVTARGTVAIEMAWFGIPTVALFDNLYSSFNFAHTCRDKESYFAILKGQQNLMVDFDKDKICSFYYQAFLENLQDEKSSILKSLAFFKEGTYNDKYLTFISESLSLKEKSNLVSCYKQVLN